MKKAKILYILKAFPVVSQTFIYGEVLGLLERGYQVRVVSLSKPEKAHSLAEHGRGSILENVKITYLSENFSFEYLKRNISQDKNARDILWALKKVILAFRVKFEKFCNKSAITNNPISIKEYLNTEFILKALTPIVEDFKPDVIYSHFATIASEVSCFISSEFNLPFVFSAHGYDMFDEPSRFWPEMLLQAENCLVYSEYSKNFIIKKYGFNNKIKVLRLGVDVNKFTPCSHKNEKFTILCVARLVSKKGQEYLLEACSKLRSEGCDFQCFLVGDGHRREELENQVRNKNLQGVVFFKGNLNSFDVSNLMKKSHLHVLPSIKEPFGIVSIEAMSAGLPVIAPNVMGSQELIQQSKAGFLVDPENVDDLSNKIKALILDSEMRATFARKGREFVLTNHTHQKWIDSVIEVLEEAH